MKRSSVIILVALGGTAALAYGLSNSDRCAPRDANSRDSSDTCQSSWHAGGYSGGFSHSSGGSLGSSGSHAASFGGFGHAGAGHGGGS